jgi:hypothetical protein
MIDTECEYCGTNYRAERISSKYCSNSCKSMAYRKRKIDYELNLIALKDQIQILAELEARNRLAYIAQKKKRERELMERQIKADKRREEREKKNKNPENPLLALFLEKVVLRFADGKSGKNDNKEA